MFLGTSCGETSNGRSLSPVRSRVPQSCSARERGGGGGGREIHGFYVAGVTCCSSGYGETGHPRRILRGGCPHPSRTNWAQRELGPHLPPRKVTTTQGGGDETSGSAAGSSGKVPDIENFLDIVATLQAKRILATALLQQNLENARASLEVLVAYLQFLRDQVTVTQVTIPRVYNWDVHQRRINQAGKEV